MQQHILLQHPNAVLVGNVHDSQYFEINKTIFILHIFAYSTMGVFVACKPVKLIDS